MTNKEIREKMGKNYTSNITKWIMFSGMTNKEIREKMEENYNEIKSIEKQIKQLKNKEDELSNEIEMLECVIFSRDY